MNINSINSSSMHKQVFNSAGKSSNKGNKTEEQKIDAEINALEQKKASLNKFIDKSKIDDLNSQIKQKQAEKAALQTSSTEESLNSNESQASDSTKNIKYSNNETSNQEEKDDHNIELLNNFVTPTGIINENKLKNKSKNSSSHLNKNNSTESISDKKKQKHAENSISYYKLMDDTDLIKLKTNALA